jgi:hypothetical protein
VKQKTLDDMEPVLESEYEPDPMSGTSSVKARSREALEAFDKIEADRLIEDDPLA